MIRYFEIEEIITLVDKLLSDTGTKLAFLNRANLEFALDSMQAQFGNELSNDVISKKSAYLLS